MPQPAANDAAARRLIDAYREAHTQMLAAYEEALADPRRVRQTARLRELLRTNEAVMDGLVDVSRAWWGATLPELHAAGAQQAASVVGSAFTWTRPHVDAVNEYVTRTWSDVAAKLTDIRAETRAALRREIQAGTRSVLLESKTAAQAARELAEAAAREGLWSVRYSNGARHTMADYFDSVIRTTTAEAYNRGSVVQTVADGFTHVEYFDGEDCGVSSHDDPVKANGLVVAVEEVVYLSHPRCRRAIMPATPDGPLVNGADVELRAASSEPPTIPARRQREPRKPRAARTARS